MKKPPEGLIFSRRDIFRIILPLVAEQFLAMFVGMADSVMISSVGEAAVSAVSLVDSVSILLIQLFTALATGGAVVAGQYLGAKNEERARRVSDQLILLIFLISAVVTAALFFLRGVILRTVFGSITQEVMGYADTYLTITLFSIPFIALYNGGAAIFRTMADLRAGLGDRGCGHPHPPLPDRGRRGGAAASAAGEILPPLLSSLPLPAGRGNGETYFGHRHSQRH